MQDDSGRILGFNAEGNPMPTLLALGARHLGGAVADRFVELGYDLSAVALSDETRQRVLQRHPQALAFAADTSDADRLEAVVAQTVDRFGGLDVAVNAASPRPRQGVFGGGPLLEATADAIEPYARGLIPQVYHFLRICGRQMAKQGHGTLIQVTGGSARRAIAGRSAWASGAFASRGLTQGAALELRDRGVHAALLIVDAVIESEKTASFLAGRRPEESAGHEDVVRAIEYLAGQSPRGWTHELTITPSADRWVP